MIRPLNDGNRFVILMVFNYILLRKINKLSIYVNLFNVLRSNLMKENIF